MGETILLFGALLGGGDGTGAAGQVQGYISPDSRPLVHNGLRLQKKEQNTRFHTQKNLDAKEVIIQTYKASKKGGGGVEAGKKKKNKVKTGL